jgi:hypothetical protein
MITGKVSDGVATSCEYGYEEGLLTGQILERASGGDSHATAARNTWSRLRQSRLWTWGLFVSAVFVATLARYPPEPAQAQETCVFEHGFKTLHDLIPEKVGDCLENERTNPVRGDSEQLTTGGLLVWRKADNWTTFTDGSTTWINGPGGLVSRPNNGPPFAWEAADAPVSSPGLAPAAWEGWPVTRALRAIGLFRVFQAVEQSSLHARMVLGVVLFMLFVVALGTERGFTKILSIVVAPLAVFVAWILVLSSPYASLLITLLLVLMIPACLGFLIWVYAKSGFRIPLWGHGRRARRSLRSWKKALQGRSRAAASSAGTLMSEKSMGRRGPKPDEDAPFFVWMKRRQMPRTPRAGGRWNDKRPG